MDPIRMTIKKGIFYLGGILFSSFISFSVVAKSLSPEITWTPLMALGLGWSSEPYMKNAQSFPIQNPVVDEFYNYSSNQATKTTTAIDLLLGGERKLNAKWRLQTGLNFNIPLNRYKVNGSFIQGADLQSADTYTYHYQVLTKQLLVYGKLLYTLKEYYHPYFLAGLGAVFNNATNYVTSVPFDLAFTRMYMNHSNTNLSYTAGLGVDVDINTHTRLGIGYRYVNLGTIQLGNAFIDTTSVSGTLSHTNVYTNQLLVQLTWLFN